MKSFLKFILVCLIIGLLGLCAYWIYDKYFGKKGDRDAFSVIPNDAVFVIETNNLSVGWRTVSSSQMWKHLTSSKFFSDLNKDITEFDQLIKGNTVLDMLLNNRKLMISAHTISKNNYDFVVVIDMEQISKVSSMLTDALKFTDYKVETRDFNKSQIIELTNPKSPKDKIYLSVADNLLIVSLSEKLIESAVNQKDVPGFDKNTKFMKVAADIRDKKLFNFYFNYSQLNNFMHCFMAENNDMVLSLSQALAYSAFHVDLRDERLIFDGNTSVNDSISTYIKALSKVDPANMYAYQVVSDQAAIYLSMTFSDFDEFYKNLELEFSSKNSADFEDYATKIKRIEKILGFNVNDDFLSWIGNEIAFVKLRPSKNARMEDVIAVFHASDLVKAKGGMKHIMEQIRKRTPFRFEAVNYKNYEINYLEIKGFFKLFLGNLFEKLEKPYFTFIEDEQGFVLFSNSESALKEAIDQYVNGKTLARKKDFMNFLDEFKRQSNVTLMVQMPKLYESLYNFSNEEKRKGIKENRDLILSFARVGFQLTSEGNMFSNRLIADYDEQALMDDELEKVEITTSDDLFLDEIDTLTFKVNPSTAELSKSNEYKLFYADQTLKFECRVKDGKLNGLAREYFENGNINATYNYTEGKVNGQVFFYYSDAGETKKAEITVVNDKISGVCTEFYQNGTIKAKIEFEEGVKHGEAEFYFENGILKIKGQYKKGLKQGKWEFYDEKGEVIDKERWRKGKSRGKQSET